MDPPTVLLVDSHEDSRLVNAALLEIHRFRVLHATDGMEAVRVARAERPRVIVMELWVPRMDGWEATRRLKGDARTAGIPVVVLTSQALPEDRRRSREAGCAEYLLKPCSPVLVLREVCRLSGIQG